VIEAFWTSVGLTLGAWWPLDAISQAIQNLATNLNMVLTPFYQHLENAAETLKNADGTINEQPTIRFISRLVTLDTLCLYSLYSV
jgi:hypothetical protein